MKYDPVKYKQFERLPVGCFSAEMTANGWANTKFDHDLQEHLLSDEVREFAHLMYRFFKECSDLTRLNKYANKYGKEVKGEDYSLILAFVYEGDCLDYSFYVNGSDLNVFPYRKIQH